MALVFLSYAHKDFEKAQSIEKRLKESGHHIWRDESSIKVGENIPIAICSGISGCDFFLTLITKNALNSSWMKDELTNFSMLPGKSGKIIPLKFDSTSIGSFYPLISALRYADFSSDFDKAFAMLLERIGPADRESESRKLQLEVDLNRLDFAVDLALRAGIRVMRFYKSSMQSNETIDKRKNAATKADQMAQKEIISKIEAHHTYCNDTIIAEEAPHDKGTVKPNGYTWVIDSLDGTTNFRNKIPLFCTAIGVLLNGKPFIGVVYDPVNQDVYYAIQGEQSKVWNVTRGEISLLHTSSEIENLNECLSYTHISSRTEIAAQVLKDDFLFDISRHVNSVRAFGCIHLAMAFVAAGKIPLFFQFSVDLWDQVAGIVIAQNAGAVVRQIPDGKEWDHSHPSFYIAANKSIADAFQTILAAHPRNV